MTLTLTPTLTLARHEPPAADVRRAFQKYDDNNSGQLDAKELRAALQDLGLRHNTAEAARVLREYDGGGGLGLAHPNA